MTEKYHKNLKKANIVPNSKQLCTIKPDLGYVHYGFFPNLRSNADMFAGCLSALNSKPIEVAGGSYPFILTPCIDLNSLGVPNTLI